MREDIQLDMISADVVDPRRGRASKATIAFAVGYESRSPELAARVANDLVSLYLRENLETRKQLAAGSTEFLSGEAEKLRVRIAELEQRIADFKEQNYDRLPEFAQANIQMLKPRQQEVRDVDAHPALDQQIAYLDAQLAQIDPNARPSQQGRRAHDGPGGSPAGAALELHSALVAYTPKHPVVIGLQHEIAALEKQVAAEKGRRQQRRPDNPAYIQISAQRQAAVSERASLMRRRGELQARIAEYERAQVDMPAVERDYGALLREMQGEQTKFAEVRQKQMAAQLAQNLESEQKGERFTLIEPPLRPQEPVSPNRPAILALGLLLSLGAAVGMMAPARGRRHARARPPRDRRDAGRAAARDHPVGGGRARAKTSGAGHAGARWAARWPGRS